jgi:phosphatidylserine/phosphatidylglycerophosphate/cardiolipin synthase-like enzyme
LSLLPNFSRKGGGISRSVALALLVALFLANVPVALAGSTLPANVTLLRNQEYGEAFLNGIRGARRSIFCAFFLFKTTASAKNRPRQIADELILARKRGVLVTVLLEQDRQSRDSLNEDNHATADFLNRGGVKVYFDSPAITTHAKVAVIDDRFVYLGSHNLTQSALLHNNELSILIDSPEMAREVLAYLDQL